MRIALAGNPNSGKTTLYNALTGRNEPAGNWAGVTVDKREGRIKKCYTKGVDMTLVDLPGAYSMSPFTSEESVTSDFVLNHKLDVVVNILDATNISRSLFFTTQLMDLGIPVVVALNKCDINEKKGTTIDEKKLSELLGCPVVKLVSIKKKGIAEVIAEVVKCEGKGQKPAFVHNNIDMTTKDAVVELDKQRFAFAEEVATKVEVRALLTSTQTVQDKVDKVIAHRWLGVLVFALVMTAVFFISQPWLGTWLSESVFVPLLESFQGWVAGLFGESVTFGSTLLVDGIIGGFVAVVGFLPLIMVMFFLIALLEDCGYMTRVAIVMDRFLKKVGLSGKSIIPMVIGIGCSIPGVMASRTIRDERQRRTTAMITPFMPCGAKLPVIALIAGVFFADSPWIGPIMYFAGIAVIILAALLIRAITGTKKDTNYFIMEVPEYKWPSLGKALMSMLERGWAFIVKAGTIILVCNALVHIMLSFDWSFTFIGGDEALASTSILATIATPFAWLFIPLGFGLWQLTAGAVTGFIAKENVIGTLSVAFGLSAFIVDDALVAGGASSVVDIMGITSVAGLAYLVFNLFTPPCFGAIGAMNSELKSKKWLWSGIALQLAVGYILAFFVYQLGTIFTGGTVGIDILWGGMAVAAMIAVIAYLAIRGSRQGKMLGNVPTKARLAVASTDTKGE